MPEIQSNYSKNSLQGVISGHFVSAGDKAAWDISNAGLTEDANYHDLDLANYGVPPNAKAVLIEFNLKNTSANKNFYMTSENYQAGIPFFRFTTQVANVAFDGHFLIYLNNSTIVEYYFADSNFTYYFSIRGWFL